MTSSVQMARGGSEFSTGWPTLLTAFIGLLFSIGPLMIYPFGVFVIPLSDEFGWSRAAIGGALAAGNITLAFAGPAHGYLIDRYGVRGPVILSCIGLALAFALIFFVSDSIWHFYACFALVALLGASASPLGYSRAVIERFDRNRGLALGLALAAVGTAAFFLPPIVQFVIDSGGWRSAYVFIGVTALIPIPIVAIVFARARQNASHGVPVAKEQMRPLSHNSTLTLTLLIGIFFLLGIVSVGVVVHLIPMLRDSGIAAGTAASVAMAVGVTLVISRAAIGWIIDRVHAPLVLVALGILFALSCLALTQSASIGLVIVAALLLGIGLGAEVDLLSFLVSRYWPSKSFGKVYGLLFGVFSVGNGLGPLFMGYAFDRFGNYQLALMVSASASVLIIGLSLFLPKYRNGNMEQIGPIV